MRAREYPTLVEAVESGIRFGWQRLWKHRNDGPDIECRGCGGGDGAGDHQFDL